MIFIPVNDYLKYNFKINDILRLNEEETEYELEETSDVYKQHKYHDKLFKRILSNPIEFAHLINTYTDYKKYAPMLKEDEIELYDKEFITKKLKKSESDIIYKVKNKDLYFILEQQTKVDNKMPIRISNYSLKLIERESEKIGEYPLVCPIVLYTGVTKWNVERTITEKQKGYYNIPKQSYPIYNLVDVGSYTKEQLIKDKSIIAKAMLFEKVKNKREIEEVLKKLLQRKMSKKEIEYVTIMLTYSNFINKKMNQEEIEKYKKLINEGGNTMVTNFERYFVELVNEKHELRKKAEAEGRAKGEAEGRAEGRAEGIISEKLKIAKNLLNMKFNIKDIEKATGLTKEEIMNLKVV